MASFKHLIREPGVSERVGLATHVSLCGRLSLFADGFLGAGQPRPWDVFVNPGEPATCPECIEKSESLKAAGERLRWEPGTEGSS